MTVLKLADELVERADQMPCESDCARHLRDAAASLLDADMAAEREGLKAAWS